MKRTRLKRRGGLGRVAEQLAWLASSVAESGSRVEDRYWEMKLGGVLDQHLATNVTDRHNRATDDRHIEATRTGL